MCQEDIGAIKHLIAAELRCSPSVMGDYIPTCQGHVGHIGAWRGVQGKTQFAHLGVLVMDNKTRRVKL